MIAIKIGIIKEADIQHKHKTPLTPAQIIQLKKKYPNLEIYVQSSENRCYSDEEYQYLGIPIVDNLENCNIIFGINKVDVDLLLWDKTYLFFGHLAKGQNKNIELLQALIKKNIKFIDYEYIKNENNKRVVALGRWAGIVGAYNALRARGIRLDSFNLKPAFECHDLDEMWAGLSIIKLRPDLKIVITGEGRAGHGALETLLEAGIMEVSPEEFLTQKFNQPTVTMLNARHYAKHKTLSVFDYNDFKNHPVDYESNMFPFCMEADILIACHYWTPNSPLLFTKEQIKDKRFRISVIADISCDIPGAIPSTLRPTTISTPFYGYNPKTEKEEVAFTNSNNITVMAIDNLPDELPRNSSKALGDQLINNVFPHLLTFKDTPKLLDATITKDKKLTEKFKYLQKFISQ